MTQALCEPPLAVSDPPGGDGSSVSPMPRIAAGTVDVVFYKIEITNIFNKYH